MQKGISDCYSFCMLTHHPQTLLSSALMALSMLSLAACGTPEQQGGRNLAEFESKLHMANTYDDITKAFGEPDRDVGSGIHIYVYELDDGTEVWIGYTDRILYARHMKDATTSLKQLLPKP